jgi:hypothetical protein
MSDIPYFNLKREYAAVCRHNNIPGLGMFHGEWWTADGEWQMEIREERKLPERIFLYYRPFIYRYGLESNQSDLAKAVSPPHSDQDSPDLPAVDKVLNCF